MHGIERLPLGADEERRNAALDGGDAARGFGVAGIDAVPDAPDVLPALPAHAVEEGELQVAGLVRVPAVADVDHVAGLKPLVAVDHGDEGKAVLAPGHHVPTEGLVAGAAFRLERRADGRWLSAASEKPSGTPSCVSPLMPSASIAFMSAAMACGQGWSGCVRSFVPHHHGEEHAHAAAMEVGDHLANAFNAAGHGLDHLELVAVVDAHVRIGGPDEHGIDAAVAFFEIVEIAVDGVAAGDGVVEVAILDHHLRLHEAGLGPAEGGQLVARGVEGGADAALGAPVLDVAEPALVCVGSAARLLRIVPGVVEEVAGRARGSAG